MTDSTLSRRGSVIIPRSDLGQKLHEAEVLKQRAAELLLQLEQSHTKRPLAKPGGWRQKPQSWPITKKTN